MSKPMDFASQARVMSAIAKCLEALGALTVDERQRAIFGLVIATLDDKEPSHKRMIDSLLSKMAEEVRR